MGGEASVDFLTWVRNQWDRVAAWACVAIGGLVLVLGWIGVTSTPYSFEQIPYVISGGLGGIFLLGVGAMLWTSADLRDEWRVLRELVDLERQRGADDGSVTFGEDRSEAAPPPAPARRVATRS
jgi:hypothetical protein